MPRVSPLSSPPRGGYAESRGVGVLRMLFRPLRVLLTLTSASLPLRKGPSHGSCVLRCEATLGHWLSWLKRGESVTTKCKSGHGSRPAEVKVRPKARTPARNPRPVASLQMRHRLRARWTWMRRGTHRTCKGMLILSTSQGLLLRRRANERARTSRTPGKAKKQGAPAWKEVDCGGGGHCFYNAIAASFILKTTGGTFQSLQAELPAKGRGLRSRLATYISQSPGKFRPYFHVPEVAADVEDREAALLELQKIENGPVPQSWDEYVLAIFRPARYADEVAFRATTSLLGVSITLVCGNLACPTQVLHYRNEKSHTQLFLRHNLGHYTRCFFRMGSYPAMLNCRVMRCRRRSLHHAEADLIRHRGLTLVTLPGCQPARLVNPRRVCVCVCKSPAGRRRTLLQPPRPSRVVPVVTPLALRPVPRGAPKLTGLLMSRPLLLTPLRRARSKAGEGHTGPPRLPKPEKRPCQPARLCVCKSPAVRRWMLLQLPRRRHLLSRPLLHTPLRRAHSKARARFTGPPYSRTPKIRSVFTSLTGGLKVEVFRRTV